MLMSEPKGPWQFSNPEHKWVKQCQGNHISTQFTMS